MKFEDKVKELENIAQKLSDESTSLEDSILLYSKGVEVAKDCLSILNENKEKMKKLSQQMDALFNGDDDEI